VAEAMRLLNTQTLLPGQFLGENLPRYAILSHTWEENEEVKLHELGQPEALSKRGYKKIKGFCDAARQDGYEWVWIDTCCINHDSDRDLSEAINSMFAWYRDSDVCYVYLPDFEIGESRSETNIEQGLRSSRWFTRGWTLQELIAPRRVLFFDANWQLIGRRSHLCDRIANITGINEDLLAKRKTLDEFSIAEKMSWAAYRRTTRLEDRAYSLLGLFDVHMPLMYGEGWKAFRRLQEEIIKQSPDQSILAWTFDLDTNARLKRPSNLHTIGLDNTSHFGEVCGILAPNPESFSWSPKIHFHRDGYLKPFGIAHAGLHIKFWVRVVAINGYQVLLEAELPCFHQGKNTSPSICLIAEALEYRRARMSLSSHVITASRVEPFFLGKLLKHAHRMEDGWTYLPFQVYPTWQSPFRCTLLDSHKVKTQVYNAHRRVQGYEVEWQQKSEWAIWRMFATSHKFHRQAFIRRKQMRSQAVNVVATASSFGVMAISWLGWSQPGVRDSLGDRKLDGPY
jgi:Heterokaryon incompatibility protein (HET)